MSLRESIDRELHDFLQTEPQLAHRFWHELRSRDRALFLRSDLQDSFAGVCESPQCERLVDTPLGQLVRWAQEAVLHETWLYFALRSKVARWMYLRVETDTGSVAAVPVDEFLAFKERLVASGKPPEWTLTVDLEPFARSFPRMREARSIGRGVEFLNRRLSSSLFEELGKGDGGLLEFLRVHRWREQQLMLNDSINNVRELRAALRAAEDWLAGEDAGADWHVLGARLRGLGFEPGWGRTAADMRQTMQLLLEMLEAPTPDGLERFLARVPMIFSVAIVSPHGWFGQSGVLGRPDTGGQVVYILDQVRALEREMRERIAAHGLDIEPQVVIVTRLIPNAEGTTSDQRLEPVAGTEHARILRVPFRTADGTVVPQWISRFEIWPFLERYAADVERELLVDLGGRPDLIVGNYSDGNLVATLLSQSLGVTQCNIAHALEKTKYLYSDLYWRETDAQYHFSCQFTADLIAMNAADFIITSTYQEIAGTDDSVGQYEAHGAFTMPGLYRVVHGIDVYDPKFNIVSPGDDAEVYFPAAEHERRLVHLAPEVDDLIDGRETAHDIRGVFEDTTKPLLFTMARMDRIKNITGLVEWYARNDALRERANLLVVSGHVDVNRSGDAEERAQIERMHALMNEYGLDGSVRWLGKHLDKSLCGELYRSIADRRGAFVQPALFEAFGLTVVEAMATGLPTFATRFGGPSEIIVDGESGFHIDPNHGDTAAQRMEAFFVQCEADADHWDRIARGGIERVAARYTWARYAERLMTLSRVYGFWKFVSDLERTETRRYLEMFYGLQFRPLAQAIG